LSRLGALAALADSVTIAGETTQPHQAALR